jgi:hypothetical protein
MSKITFRADDDLIAQLEALDVSKSEAMREALRAYLADREPSDAAERTPNGAVDNLIRDRVDELLAERLDARSTPPARTHARPQDVNVTVSLEGVQLPEGGEPDAQLEAVASDAANDDEGDSHTPPAACNRCGEHVDSDHVHCPNCGEKASQRLFCDCGDEIRSDWAFCPGCGRRTPAADVLDSTPPK